MTELLTKCANLGQIDLRRLNDIQFLEQLADVAAEKRSNFRNVSFEFDGQLEFDLGTLLAELLVLLPNVKGVRVFFA